MKRNLIIAVIFAVLFVGLCLMSCTCEGNTEKTVFKADCGGNTNEQETLNGCHLNNSCVDCYWFPMANGCYGNEFTENEYFSGCMPPSCVVCGFDCTLVECYGTGKDEGTNYEDRPVRTAVNGVDYTIDSFVVAVDDQVQEFRDGKINWEDLEEFIKIIMLDDAATIRFYVEYTAINELHSAEFVCDFQYGSAGEVFTNFTDGVRIKMGNVTEYVGENNWKSDNIQPGKHMMTAIVNLNAYELMALENMPNWSFTAYAYGEQAEG